MLLTSVAGIVGSAIGCALLLVLPGAVFDAVVPALVLLASAVLALQPRIKRWIGTPRAGGAGPAVGAVAGGVPGGHLRRLLRRAPWA